MGYGLIDLSPAGQRQSEVVVGLGVLGLDFQGLAVMGYGLIDLSAIGQGHAQVAVGLGIVGLDFQSLLKMNDGLIDPSAIGQGHAQVAVGQPTIGVPVDRIPPKNRDIRVHPALPPTQDSQHGQQRHTAHVSHHLSPTPDTLQQQCRACRE